MRYSYTIPLKYHKETKMKTYVIAQIVYGIEINNEIMHKYSLEKYMVKKLPGFLKFNFEHTQIPVFGIVLDTVASTKPVSHLQLKASDEVKGEYQDLIDSVNPELQHVLRSIKPQELFLWTTSSPDKKAILIELMVATYNYAYAYEAWNYTGSREDRETKAYNEALLNDLEAEHDMPNFVKTEQGQVAYHAACDAFFKHRTKTRDDYDPNYTQEDGLEKLLESLI